MARSLLSAILSVREHEPMSISRFISPRGGAPTCALPRLLLVIGTLSAGCYSVTNRDLTSGFVLRTAAPRVTWESGGVRQELYYRGSNGKHRCVWKYVSTAHAGKGTAAFIGWREASDALRGDEYLAAKESGPAVVITKAVLVCCAKKQNGQAEEYVTRHGAYQLRPKGDSIEFEFATHGVNQPHLLVELTWDEISALVDTVRRTGRPHKDKVSGITYWE